MSTISAEGKMVSDEGGFLHQPEYSLKNAPRFDVVFVCCWLDMDKNAEPKILAWLRALDRTGVNLGAICTGTQILIKAGVLGSRRCTIHWENAAGLRENYPEIDLRESLFEIDGNRLTCAGGTASLDLMLNVISGQHGAELAIDISHQFQHNRIRTDDAQQNTIELLYQRTGNWRTAKACQFVQIADMATLTPGKVATHVNLSIRQLERLFRSKLGCTPKRYIVNAQLKHARELLRTTDMTILDAALAAGFRSRSSFNSNFQRYFGQTPNEERTCQL